MTNFEASNTISHFIGNLDMNSKHDHELAIALVMGLDALERDIAKKPKENPAGCLNYLCCPNCNEYVNGISGNNYFEHRYCPNCGQAIDWQRGK